MFCIDIFNVRIRAHVIADQATIRCSIKTAIQAAIAKLLKHVVKFVSFGLRHFFIIPTVILLVTLMKSCFQWQPFSKESVNFTISMFVFRVSFVFQLVNFFKYLTQIHKGVLQSTTTDNESSSRAEIFSIIQSN